MTAKSSYSGKNKKKPADSTAIDWQREWVELVHNGECCGFDDPQAERKAAFYKKLKEEEGHS